MSYSFQNRNARGNSRQNTKSRNRSRNKLGAAVPFLLTGFGFVAFALCVPSNPSQKSEARIFTQGVSIQIDRSSPAYAALEDSLMEDTQPSDDSFNGSANDHLLLPTAVRVPKVLVSTLTSGATSAVPLAIRIERETKREEDLYAQARAWRGQVATPAAQVAASTTVVKAQAIELQPSVQQTAQKPIEHKTVVLSLADLGVKSREELANRLSAPITQAVNEFSPSSVRVAGLGKTPNLSKRPSFADGLSQARTLASTAAREEAARSFAASSVKDEVVLENPNENVRQVVISGNLEFMGGIAVTSSNDRVVIYREEDGEKLEPGAVWLRDARYEIFVDRPVGRLVAELRAISGEILGRGYYELEQLPKLNASSYRSSGIAIKLGPVPHGISGRVMNGVVANSKSFALENASVSLEQLPYNTLSQKEGKFEEKTLMEGSSVVTRTERQGSWGTLAFAHTGHSLDVALYSDQAMRALIKAGAPTEMNSDRSSAYIWGRITRGGSTIGGAKVDLMTTDRRMKPIYFNKLGMPDPTLVTTTENGLYAFFPVPAGAHAIQAGDVHGITEPNLFPADEHTVTQVDLELKVTQQAKVRVFDAFKTDFPLASEVISAGRKRGAMVPREGEAKVTFTGGTGLLVLDSDAGNNYDRVRLTVARDSRTIDFPMIQTGWIDSLLGSLRLNRETGTGMIVGFVRGTSLYRVALDEKSVSQTSRVVYFDAQGKLTRNEFGETGGGFVIFNVPAGFRTVLIQPSGTTKALGAAVLVDSSVTNVISKNLQ